MSITGAAAGGPGSCPASRPPPPDAFLCPVSQEIMDDPVFAAESHSYQRSEIEKWFATGRRTSPMTNSALKSLVLTPNHSLKSQIKDWQGRSNPQWVTAMVGEIAMADDPKAVEKKLRSLALFVGQNKAVVQPQTLQKLSRLLQGASEPVHECLRVVEAECQLVVAGFAARLQHERRDQGLAVAAAAAAKAKLARLDIEIAAVEEQLEQKKQTRAQLAKRMAGLERVRSDCGANVAQVTKELGGYPEPLCLLDDEAEKTAEEDEHEKKAAAATCKQQTRSKRKRAGTKEVVVQHGTAVSKRQRRGGASSGSSAPSDFEALLREGLEWYRGDSFRVQDKVRGRLLVEAAAEGGLPLAVAACQLNGWCDFCGDDDDETAAFDKFRELVVEVHPNCRRDTS